MDYLSSIKTNIKIDETEISQKEFKIKDSESIKKIIFNNKVFLEPDAKGEVRINYATLDEIADKGLSMLVKCGIDDNLSEIAKTYLNISDNADADAIAGNVAELKKIGLFLVKDNDVTHLCYFDNNNKLVEITRTQIFEDSYINFTNFNTNLLTIDQLKKIFEANNTDTLYGKEIITDVDANGVQKQTLNLIKLVLNTDETITLSHYKGITVNSGVDDTKTETVTNENVKTITANLYGEI